MKMINLTSLAALLLFFSENAFAVENSIAALCPKLASLNGAIRHCQNNPLYIEAAKICLVKLGKEIKSRTESLATAMNLENGNSASAQYDKLKNHAQNLESTKNSLKSVLASAELVRANMVAYRDNFMRAGLVGPAFAKQLHRPLLDLLESFPCYRNNHAAISKLIIGVEKKIQQLNDTISGTIALDGRTLASEISIGADSVQNKPGVSQTQGSGAGRQGPPAQNSKSGLTGLDVDAAKRAQKK